MNFSQILWISHSALSAYSRCPQLYYYEYVYRNPKTGNRIQIVNPYLSLGSAVHETIESLLDVPIKERTKISLKDRFEKIFDGYKGKKGGFLYDKKEEEFRKRGLMMVERVEKSNFLEKPSTKMESDFPTVDLIKGKAKLVGSLDWVEVLPSGGAHIIDFKTGNNKEVNGSLQLPIYAILAQNNLSLKVEKVSYWYLQHSDDPVAQEIGDTGHHLKVIKERTDNIKKAIAENHFPCKYNGKCFACDDYRKIFDGEAEMIGTDSGRKKDLFFVFNEKEVAEKVLESDFLTEDEKIMFRERVGMMEKTDNLTKERNKKAVSVIKNKLKENLSKGEIAAVIKLLNKNGKRSRT